MKTNSLPEHILEALTQNRFHKLIVGAAVQDFKTIQDYAYYFAAAGAEVIDISAFPSSVLNAKLGIKKALDNFASLNEPLLMVSVNIGQDPHFRKIKIDRDSCTECLACIPSCPAEVFYTSTAKKFDYNTGLCYGCDNCLDFCNYDALSLEHWKQFDSNSLQELHSLGANAIEFHLNNDLKEFQNFYRELGVNFKLESFCIGSEQMNDQELKQATDCIITEFYDKHSSDSQFIIQTDGIPQSGAKYGNNTDKDLASIHNAATVAEYISEKFTAYKEQIFIQIAGGINTKSLAKSLNLGTKINGVAIGSYARKQLLGLNNNESQSLSVSKHIVEESKKFTTNVLEKSSRETLSKN